MVTILLVLACGGLSAPASAAVIVPTDDLTLDDKQSVSLLLTNPDDAEVRLDPQVQGSAATGCSVTADPASLAAHTSTTVVLALSGATCEVSQDVILSPASGVRIKVAPAAEAARWDSLVVGARAACVVSLIWALLLARALIGRLGRETLKRKAGLGWQESRAEGAADETGFWTPLARLENTWDFEKSWVTNVTVGTSGLAVLLTSTDLLKAWFGKVPASLASVIAVTAAATAFLLVLAVFALRLLTPTVNQVTVGGFGIATVLVVSATVFQLTTVGWELGRRSVGQPGVTVMIGVLTVLTLWYALRVTMHTVGTGLERGPKGQSLGEEAATLALI